MSRERVRASARFSATSSGAIRRETFNGREYVVVPIVAMVGDAVVSAMGSGGRAELVPLGELELTPAAWNGRPIITDHPVRLDETNTPDYLEQHAIGLIFNTKIKNGKLAMEGWFDAAKAAEIGPEEAALVERVAAGDVLQVSVGCWVFLDMTPGVSPSGKKYDAVWRDLIPDHLAVGLGGAEGACSVDMGCGTRAAKARPIREEAIQVKSSEEGFLARVLRAFSGARPVARFAQPDTTGQSDNDLRQQLWSALRSVEPAFDWIEAVFVESSSVVYAVSPDNGYELRSRTYSIGADGEVALADDAVAVEPHLDYKPVTASAAPEPEIEIETSATTATAAVDCGCKTPAKATGEPAESTDHTKEGPSMDKLKELVGRLMGNTSLPAELKCETALTALGEERLTALDARYAAAVPPTATAPPTPPAAPAAQVKLTREEMLAEFPDVKELIEREASRKKDERDALLVRLAKEQKAFTPEQLSAKETSELVSIAALLDSFNPEPDYIGKGGVVTREAAAAAEPPNAWGLDANAQPLAATKGAN